MSNPKRRTRDEKSPTIPTGFQEDIRLKIQLRKQWQITRVPTLKAEVIRLQRSVTRRLNEWRNDQWSATLESLDPKDQSLWRITKKLMRLPTPSPPLVTPGGFAVSHSKNAEALADNLETQLQPVIDPSFLAFIEMVDVALRSYFLSPSSEPQLSTPDEVLEAIMGLKISKAPVPKGIPNSAQKHLPKRAVSFLAHFFKAVLRTYHFPQAWKHA